MDAGHYRNMRDVRKDRVRRLNIRGRTEGT